MEEGSRRARAEEVLPELSFTRRWAISWVKKNVWVGGRNRFQANGVVNGKAPRQKTNRVFFGNFQVVQYDCSLEGREEGWDLKPARQALGTLKRPLQFIPQALYNPWSIFSNGETLIYVLDVKNCFESSRKRDSKGGKIWKGLQSGDQLEATGSEKAGGPELRGTAGRRRGEKDHDVFLYKMSSRSGKLDQEEGNA